MFCWSWSWNRPKRNAFQLATHALSQKRAKKLKKHDKIEKGKFLRDSKEISNYKIFPEGINVSLVEIKTKKEINVITFERGAGLTNACGTGACASVMACHKLNLCDRRVRVNMIGGELDIEISEDRHIFMVGEAKEVFQGEFEIEKLG